MYFLLNYTKCYAIGGHFYLMTAMRQSLLSLVRKSIWGQNYANTFDVGWYLAAFKIFDACVNAVDTVSRLEEEKMRDFAAWDSSGTIHPSLLDIQEDFPDADNFAYLCVIVVFSPWLQQHNNVAFERIVEEPPWSVNYRGVLRTTSHLLGIMEHYPSFVEALRKAENDLHYAFEHVLRHQLRTPREYFDDHRFGMPPLTVRSMVTTMLEEVGEDSMLEEVYEDSKLHSKSLATSRHSTSGE